MFTFHKGIMSETPALRYIEIDGETIAVTETVIFFHEMEEAVDARLGNGIPCPIQAFSDSAVRLSQLGRGDEIAFIGQERSFTVIHETEGHRIPVRQGGYIIRRLINSRPLSDRLTMLLEDIGSGRLDSFELRKE